MKIKNYTSFKIENEIPTHEGAVAPARVLTFVRKNEHRFNGKFLWLSPICFVQTRIFPNSATPNFVKPFIMPNFKIALHNLEQPNQNYGKTQ